MSTSSKRRFKWYQFEVARKIRILEGEELINELENVIEDIKTKKLDKIGMFRYYIKHLEGLISETKSKPRQKSRQYDPFYIPRSGDGRVVLFGISNVGKSTLMNAITNTDVKIGNYLHTTRTALAGTCIYDNVKIQIVDLPGFLDFKEDWNINKQILRVARTCDAILLVIDLSIDIDRQYNFLIEQLKTAKIFVKGQSIYKLGIIATKGDLPGSHENFEKLKTITTLDIHPVSIKNTESLNNLKKYLFNILDVVRIYTKPPRKEVDYKHPFICPIGTTIKDLAEKIHRDFLILFRYAKVWGSSVEFAGQQMGLDHELSDKDIVEITLTRKK